MTIQLYFYPATHLLLQQQVLQLLPLLQLATLLHHYLQLPIELKVPLGRDEGTRLDVPRPLALSAFSVTKRSLGDTGECGSGEIPFVGGVGDAYLVFGEDVGPDFRDFGALGSVRAAMSFGQSPLATPSGVPRPGRAVCYSGVNSPESGTALV